MFIIFFASTEHPLLLSEKPWNPRENREKTIQLVFEKCIPSVQPSAHMTNTLSWSVNVPAFTFATDASLTMFAAGKTTGLSVNCGHDATSVTPVYEGMIPSSTSLSLPWNVHFFEKAAHWLIQLVLLDMGEITSHWTCLTDSMTEDTNSLLLGKRKLCEIWRWSELIESKRRCSNSL